MATAPVAAFVAIYPDADEARRAAQDVHRPDTRIDDPHDRLTSLRAEMREEIEHTVFSPQGGVLLTKEMSKSAFVLVPIAAVVGAVIALPIGAVAFDGDDRGPGLIWSAIIGAVMGGVIGTIIAAALGARGPADQSAGHVGVPLRVPVGPADTDADDAELLRALLDHHPLRIDAVDERGTPLGTLTTEEEGTPEGIVQRLRHQFTQDPHGDWSSAQGREVEHLQDVNRQIADAAKEDESLQSDGTLHDSFDLTAKGDAGDHRGPEHERY